MMHTTTAGDYRIAGGQQAHEHAWVVESAHNTSEGRVLYVRCAGNCGARRIDAQEAIEVPPSEVSVVVGG